jgi:hypothetical protein
MNENSNTDKNFLNNFSNIIKNKKEKFELIGNKLKDKFSEIFNKNILISESADNRSLKIYNPPGIYNKYNNLEKKNKGG